MAEFDPVRHTREKNRRLEQSNAWLRELNQKLIEMVALLSEIATAKTNVQPTALVSVVEDLVNAGWYAPRQEAS